MPNFRQNIYGTASLIGAADLPVVAYPYHRAGKRRTDPDLSSSTPYYPSLNGKTLAITGKTDSGAPFTVTVTFTSNDYQTAISTVSSASAHLLGIDDDGFLRIQSRYNGGLGFLLIGDSSTADSVLGLEKGLAPGALSSAGDIDFTPPNKRQQGIRTSRLLAHDENLTSASINRAILGSLTRVEALIEEFDREIVSYWPLAVTVYLDGTGQTCFDLHFPADPTGVEERARLPLVYHGARSLDPGNSLPDLTLSMVPNPGATGLNDLVSVRDGANREIFNSTTGARVQVNGVFYRSAAQHSVAMNDAGSFTAWGTPDGASVFGNQSHWQKPKQASIAITEIRGNLAYCAGAQFRTKGVQAGDTVFISGATNTQPFNHNGEHLVERVISETVIAVRRKSPKDPAIFTGTPFPERLNPKTPGSYGSLMVPIGHYLPLQNLCFRLNQAITPGAYRAVLALAAPLRSTLPSSFTVPIHSDRDEFTQAANIHYNGSPAWLDASTIPAGTIENAIDTVVSGLSSSTSPNAGAQKLGIATPPNWVSGQNPIAALSIKSIQNCINQMITQLAATTPAQDGAAQIGCETKVFGNGFQFTTNSIRGQLDELAANLDMFAGGGGGGGGSLPPGGPQNSIQVNNGAGAFAGYAVLTFDGTDIFLDQDPAGVGAFADSGALRLIGTANPGVGLQPQFKVFTKVYDAAGAVYSLQLSHKQTTGAGSTLAAELFNDGTFVADRLQSRGAQTTQQIGVFIGKTPIGLSSDIRPSDLLVLEAQAEDGTNSYTTQWRHEVVPIQNPSPDDFIHSKYKLTNRVLINGVQEDPPFDMVTFGTNGQFIIHGGSTEGCIEFPAGPNAAVSPANKVRFRYNSDLGIQRPQISVDGGIYFNLTRPRRLIKTRTPFYAGRRNIATGVSATVALGLIQFNVDAFSWGAGAQDALHAFFVIKRNSGGGNIRFRIKDVTSGDPGTLTWESNLLNSTTELPNGQYRAISSILNSSFSPISEVTLTPAIGIGNGNHILHAEIEFTGAANVDVGLCEMILFDTALGLTDNGGSS